MAARKKTSAQRKGRDTNPDPITGEPGSHPVGVGMGTAAGSAAAAALGAVVGGPIGAVVGAIAGGVAGGLGGKEVAEAIDPTAEDAYWSKEYKSRPYVKPGTPYDAYRPAYRYGVEMQQKYADRSFADAEADLRKGWTKARGSSTLAWTHARDAVHDAFDRTIQLREEQLHPRKEAVRGEVKVRKDVITEQQTVVVPVKREEVVIERRPVNQRATADKVTAQEVRIPVRSEKVHADKRTVVNEEVKVSKRQVQGTERVSGTVRKEKLRVEEKGKTNVRRK